MGKYKFKILMEVIVNDVNDDEIITSMTLRNILNKHLRNNLKCCRRIDNRIKSASIVDVKKFKDGLLMRTVNA